MNIRKVLLIIGAVAIMWVSGVAFFYNYYHGSIDVGNESWSTFGSFFGGTSAPILSFLALVAILWTINVQNISSEKQNFDKTFFEMLHLLGSIVEDICITVPEQEKTVGGLEATRFTLKWKTYSGRSCLKYLRDELQNIYNKKVAGKTITPDEYPQYIKQSYDEFAHNYEHLIGHYFRFLYRIFKHIHISDPAKKLKIDKKFYACNARAMLSSNELALLFYDCFYGKGAKFAALIIEYSLLENMEFEKLLDKENHIPLFDKNAYGDEDWSLIRYNPNVPVHFRGAETPNSR